jgi:NTE family protein
MMNNQVNRKKAINLFWIIIIFIFCFFYFFSFSYAKPKIGIALGAGEERLYVHVGVLKVLEKEGIKLDYIAGTSMGSFIGGLYALWEDVQKIEEYVLNIDFSKYFRLPREDIRLKNIDNNPFMIFYLEPLKNRTAPQWLKGLIDGRDIKDEIDRLTNWATFEYDLKIPFKAIATDLETGEKVVMDRGKISNAIVASLSKPGTFAPFKFEDKILVDGGLVDPVPADVVREMGADLVIGVSLSDVQRDVPLKIDNVISIVTKTIYIMLDELNKSSSSKADIVIKPWYRGPLSFDLSREEKLKLIQIGEEETQKIIPLLKQLIDTY